MAFYPKKQKKIQITAEHITYYFLALSGMTKPDPRKAWNGFASINPNAPQPARPNYLRYFR